MNNNLLSTDNHLKDNLSIIDTIDDSKESKATSEARFNDLCKESEVLIRKYGSYGANIDKIKDTYNVLKCKFDQMIYGPENQSQSQSQSQSQRSDQYIQLIHEFRALIDQLIQGLESMESMNHSLEQRLRVLENKESQRETRAMINKYMIAIQDYNNRYGVEGRLGKDSEARISLNRLRHQRNGQCHYCSKFCTDQEAVQRFNVMIQRIGVMDPGVKFVIEKKYPGLLEAILRTKVKKFRKSEVIPDSLTVDQINEWWDEL
jgi:hypothetical protein